MDKQQTLQVRRRLLGLIAGGSLISTYTPAIFAASRLSQFRVVRQSNLMLHLDFDQPVGNVDVFALSNPDRLVIDVEQAELHTPLDVADAFGAMRNIRHGYRSNNTLRIAMDMATAARPEFEIIARQGGQRLIVDTGLAIDPDAAPINTPPKATPAATSTGALRDVIVAIDPGHGGKDPGAMGQRKTLEKDITLAVARRLYDRLNNQEGISAVLTRSEDSYIALRKRIDIAREQRADIFISIHADAFKRKAAQGSSVYALSLKGASSEAAQWLAEKENEVDALFGDVELEGLSVDLKQTLLDLAQNSTLEASLDMGAEVLQQLKRVGAVHKPNVEQANFAVLRSPDIPSVLVEIAFISNLLEERKLNNERFQDTLAIAIQNGVVRYLNRRAPEGTRLAAARDSAG